MAISTSPQQASTGSGVSKSLTWKVIVGFVVVALLPSAIMFLAAGRVDWWEAWGMVGVLALTTIGSRMLLLLKHPDLAAERARWTEGRGFKSWDRNQRGDRPHRN